MYSYEDRIRAVKLYIKPGKRTGATIRQLGYPTKNSLEKIWSTLCASALDARILIQSNAAFFEIMKERKEVCSRAWLFGIFVALGLGAGTASISVCGHPANS
ncbi:hypothetical protein C6382_00405 [Pseudomonas sp. BBP2017]|nr:hypothetical protein C6382_00405 [Pseudomonas sp. BBP2017]